MNNISRKSTGLSVALLLTLPWLMSCSVSHSPSPDPFLEAVFTDALERFQAQKGFPGITASYVLPGGKQYSAAAGWADLERGEAMTVESRMLAASIGKTFVAATMVSLAREQAIDLETPASNWLDRKSWFGRLPNHQSMTLRQLLNHTSGLSNHVYEPAFAAAVSGQWPASGNPFTPDVLVSFVLDKEPLFYPGEGWAYTDTGYILLGFVIEAITGRTYYQEINDRFLGPLGLTSTTPSNQRTLLNLAAGYVAADNPFDFPPKTTDQNGVMVWHPGMEWTGGGLVSTSRDLAHWGNELFLGQALPDEDLNTMLESVSIGEDSPGTQYGLGIAIRQSGPLSPVFGHGGWIPGYSSSLRHYPKNETTIAFQVNSDRISHQHLSEIELCLARIVISGGHDTHCVPKVR